MRLRLPFAPYRRIALYSGCALALILTGTLPSGLQKAGAVQAQQAYTIQRTYKAGAVDRYNLVLHIVTTSRSGESRDVNMEILIKETTKDVKADGSAVIAIEFESAIAKLNGAENEITSFLIPYTQTRSRSDAILETKMDGAVPKSGQLAQLNAMISSMLSFAPFFYPTRALDEGGTWKIDVKSVSPNMAASTGEGKLTAVKHSGDRLAATTTISVKQDLTAIMKSKLDSAPTDSAPHSITAQFDGSGNFDLSTGKLERVTGTHTTTRGTAVASKIELTLSLVTDKAGRATK